MASLSRRLSSPPLCTTCSATHAQKSLTDGRTSPYHAAATGDCKTCIIRLTPRKRFDSNASDDGGLSALHIAARDSSTAAVKALLRDPKTERNPLDPLRLTPLHYAVISGNVEAVRFLVEDSETELEPVSKSGKTPLHFAAAAGKFRITYFLYNRRSPSSPLPSDDEFNTPLDCASLNGHDRIIELLERTPIQT